MFKTQTTSRAAPGHAAVRRFMPRLTPFRRPAPAFHPHANDNRAGPRPHGCASPLAAPRLVCRWQRDPATGRLVCSWQLETGEALAGEPEPSRCAA